MLSSINKYTISNPTLYKHVPQLKSEEEFRTSNKFILNNPINAESDIKSNNKTLKLSVDNFKDSERTKGKSVRIIQFYECHCISYNELHNILSYLFISIIE